MSHPTPREVHDLVGMALNDSQAGGRRGQIAGAQWVFRSVLGKLRLGYPPNLTGDERLSAAEYRCTNDGSHLRLGLQPVGMARFLQ